MSHEQDVIKNTNGKDEEKDKVENKNANKKAKMFDLEAMLAETKKVAKERNAAKTLEDIAKAKSEEESSWKDLPTGFGGKNAQQFNEQSSSSLGTASEISDDDDDFLVALPPGFVPDKTVMVEEDKDSDFDDYEGEGTPVVKLIPTSHEALTSHGSKPVSAARFEPLGQRFATGGLDYVVKLFDFQKMDMSLRADKDIAPCEAHVINSVCFSPNGENLVVCSGEAIIRIFGRDGEQWAETNKGDQYLVDVANTKGHTASVNCCAWSNFDKHEFLTCSDDGTVRIWSLEDFKELSKAINKHSRLMKTKTANGKRAMPQTCCYSPDGKMIAAGCDDGSVQAWKDGRFVQPFYIARNAHKGPLTCICFSPDSKKILSRGLDDSMKMWALTDTKKPILEKYDLENAFKSTDCGFSPRGELVYTGTSCPNAQNPGQLLFFNAETFDLVYKIDFPGLSVIRIDWHARINQILTTFSDGSIKIFYDQKMSQRGVLQCITKPVKRSRVKEVVQEDMILAPLALEMFQPRGEDGEEKEVTHWRLKKYMRMRDNQLRPEFRKPADIPMDGPSANGRVAESGSTLHSYLAKQIGTQRNKEFLEDTDVRTAILRHAEDAAKNPMYIDKAYKRNQPTPIFQEKTTAPEEEEGEKELQPLFKMPRLK